MLALKYVALQNVSLIGTPDITTSPFNLTTLNFDTYASAPPLSYKFFLSSSLNDFTISGSPISEQANLSEFFRWIAPQLHSLAFIFRDGRSPIPLNSPFNSCTNLSMLTLAFEADGITDAIAVLKALPPKQIRNFAINTSYLPQVLKALKVFSDIVSLSTVEKLLVYHKSRKEVVGTKEGEDLLRQWEEKGVRIIFGKDW